PPRSGGCPGCAAPCSAGPCTTGPTPSWRPWRRRRSGPGVPRRREHVAVSTSPGLDRALVALVETATLLVASDYDGTLSPIVDDPEAARPAPGAVAALTAISELADTYAAVVSGRALRDLVRLSGIG